MEFNKNNSKDEKLKRSMPARKPIPNFDEPLFSPIYNNNWPLNYEDYYEDYLTTFNYLHLFTSKETFFDFFQISDFLIEYTSTWEFEKFVGAFVYHYIVSELKTNNYVLSAYNWKKIIEFMLLRESTYIVIHLVKNHNFSSFSKKQDIIDGAAQAIGNCANLVDLEEPSFYPIESVETQSLRVVLQFLEVGTKSTNLLVKSLYADKNPKKIALFLKDYEWS